MASAKRVINVTPRTRTESFVDALALIVQVVGWFFVAAASIQALGAVVTVLVGLALVFIGRRTRGL